MALFINGKRALVVGDVSQVSGTHCNPSTAVGGLNGTCSSGDKYLIVLGDPWTSHTHTPDCDVLILPTQAQASSILNINGIPVAVEGDLLSCGATTL